MSSQGQTPRKLDPAPRKQSVPGKSPEPVSAPGKKVYGPRPGCDIDPKHLGLVRSPNDALTSLEFLVCTISETFGLKTSQSLGLLSNDAKFLLQLIIKGLKGDTKPVTEWYIQILSHADHLLSLLDSDSESWTSTKHLLDIFKTGLFSKDPDVSVLACKLLVKFAVAAHAKGLSGVLWEWFIGSTLGGLQGVVKCLQKNRSSVVEAALSVLCEFGKYNLTELFTHYLVVFIPEVKDYLSVVASFVPPLSQHKEYKELMQEADVLRFWLDFACKKADLEPMGYNKGEERAAAIGLLYEMWECFPEAVESTEYADLIIKVAQRANRDRTEALQIVSLAVLFKLLDIFTETKNPYAPVVYKTLTFALVENHQRESVRQFIIDNFKNTLSKNELIPVAIMAGPFIKQMRRSEGVTFFYNTFDFSLFAVVAAHNKLSVSTAVQAMDILAKVYTYDGLFAPCALACFMDIVCRNKEESAVHSFVAKLVQVLVNIYVGHVKKEKRSGESKWGKYLSYINAKLDDNKLLAATQRMRIIDLLCRMLELDVEQISEKVQAEVLAGNFAIKAVTCKDDEAFVSVLRKLGEVEELIKEFDLKKRQEGGNKEPRAHRGQANSVSPGRKKKSVDHVRRSQKLLGLVPTPREDRLDASSSSEQTPGKSSRNYSLTPYRSSLEQKAIRELALVKKRQEDLLERKRIEENRKKLQEVHKKRLAEKRLEIIRVEQGVLSKHATGENVVELAEGEYTRPSELQDRKSSRFQLTLLKLDEEEEKDLEAVRLFLEEQRKVFQYLFSTYSIQGVAKGRYLTFDQRNSKAQVLVFPSLQKMLVDHGLTQHMISHVELKMLVKLVAEKYTGNPQDTELTYEAFQELFIQLAHYMYTKAKFGLAHMSVVSLAGRLLAFFAETAKQRGVTAFEKAQTACSGDCDVVRELTRMLEQDPDSQLPEGYKKVLQKHVKEDFVLRDYYELPESLKVAAETLDEILNSVVDTHFIEPTASYYYTYKAQPVIPLLALNKGQSEELSASPTAGSASCRALRGAQGASSCGVKAHLSPQGVLARLTPNMKLAIAYAPAEDKQIVRETAGVLEEVIEAVEKGRDHIGFRVKLSQGVPSNRLAMEKLQEQQREEQRRVLVEEKRKVRAEKLKLMLRGSASVKELRQAERAQKQQEAEEKKRRKMERIKKEYDELKQKIVSEHKGDPESESPILPAIKPKAKKSKPHPVPLHNPEELKAMQKKRQEEYARNLRYMLEDRARKKRREEERKEEERSRIEKQKKRVLQSLAKEKELREAQKQQKASVEAFVRREDVGSVFARYKKPLQHVFVFASRQGKVDLGAEKAQASLRLPQLAKLCSLLRIVPDMLSYEDVNAQFRAAVNAKSTAMEYEDFLEFLARVALLLKDRLVLSSAALNRALEVAGADGRVIESLLYYTELSEPYSKLQLDQRLNQRTEELKSGRSHAVKSQSPIEDTSPKPEPEVNNEPQPGVELDLDPSELEPGQN